MGTRCVGNPTTASSHCPRPPAGSSIEPSPSFLRFLQRSHVTMKYALLTLVMALGLALTSAQPMPWEGKRETVELEREIRGPRPTLWPLKREADELERESRMPLSHIPCYHEPCDDSRK